MVDWDDLRVFREAVRAGDYTAAARSLGMDRTTVGRRLARLEARLGEAIWSLTESGYRPTALGHELLQIAETMEHALGRLDPASSRSAMIRVAGSAGLGELLLPQLRGILNRLSGVTIDLTAAPSAAAAVQARSADLGIVIGRDPPPGTTGVRAGSFRQARYAAIGETPSLRRISWSPATMLANPFGWARLNAPDPATACEVGGMAAMASAVAGGLGTAWLWDRLGDADPRLCRLPDPAPASAASDLWIVHRDDMAAAPAALRLRDALAEMLSKDHAASELSRIASPAAR